MNFCNEVGAWHRTQRQGVHLGGFEAHSITLKIFWLNRTQGNNL
jgi:hypothetical protein